ncbi:hypothetical protein [Bdellovibrio sp. HCB209]|uniref:hypothetical protein n=1 Tax=Bdellovibrio sp. HCB209 TaxID=3394354 RepID=UPI0039B67BA6
MKLWILVATPLMIVLSFALNANAQYAAAYGNAGIGMYGGMQACPYNYGGAQAATSEDDEVSNIKQTIAEMKKEQAQKKSELKRMETELKRAKRDIDDVIADPYSSVLYNHMDNVRSCNEYQGTGGSTEDGSEVSSNENPESGQLDSPEPFSLEAWSQGVNPVCDRRQRGTINPQVCISRVYQTTDHKPGNSDRCKKALTSYKTSTQKASKLRDEIEGLKRAIEYKSDDLKDARQAAIDARREAQQEATEGGICPGCATSGNGYTYQKPQTDWASVVANVGMGVLGTYLGYQQNKMVVENNANLGYPSNPYPSWGYGFPYFATGLTQALGGGSGVYGAIGGGVGAGGFGCSGQNGGPYGMYGPYAGANGTGMWGNPYAMSMMNPMMGGGMYPGGMGPWGMSGPMGMGYPGLGMNGMGMMGAYMGTYMGNMMGAYPGGMMGSYPGGMMGALVSGMGMMGSYPGGMGMSGMMGAYPGGYGMMGAYPGSMGMGMGMMGSYPGMGMMGSYPGGMAYPGSMVGGVGMGMMGSYPGGMGMSGMMGAYPGGMGMMGTYGSYMGAMSSGYAGDMGMMQMQQQMMQMQMQQYQAQMAQQQAYMQSQMQRQQASASVVQEIMSLQQRLYYIQSGAYSGSPGYIGGSGSSGYYNNGYFGSYGGGTVLPSGVITGGGNTATTPIGGGVTVPGTIPVPTGTTGVGVGTGR